MKKEKKRYWSTESLDIAEQDGQHDEQRAVKTLTVLLYYMLPFHKTEVNTCPLDSLGLCDSDQRLVI